jgi:outer membrane protein OmpA-like peptidoglycan-associated protein
LHITFDTHELLLIKSNSYPFSIFKRRNIMKNNGIVFIVILLCISIVMMGCGTSKAVQGGAIGVAGGGLIGAIIGKLAGNTAAGAIIGAAVGGTAGALIGHNMDKQAEEMKNDLSNAKVERVGEGIKITFNSGILFKTGSYELQVTAKENIASLSKILNKYPDTNIIIEGDTDSEGSEEYNQKLSERRAQAVADYTKSLGVDGVRISTIGKGESNPVASNETVEGRALNRRVELAIFANEKMKKAAEDGTLN